jgi:hypothetical protein
MLKNSSTKLDKSETKYRQSLAVKLEYKGPAQCKFARLYACHELFLKQQPPYHSRALEFIPALLCVIRVIRVLCCDTKKNLKIRKE